MASPTTDVLQTDMVQPLQMPSASPKKPAWGGAGLTTQTINIKSANSLSNITSFKDLMSEDLAKDLKVREEAATTSQAQAAPEFKFGACIDTTDDLLLAQVLQYEYDKEFDSQLQREEKHFNKNSKLAVSFNKYKVCPSWYRGDSDDEDGIKEVDEENRALDSFEERAWDDPVIPPCGYIRHNNKIVTKHDTSIAGRKNAQRFMNLPPEFNTGDGGGFDMKLSNKVYNKLMSSSLSDSRKKQRIHDKIEKATVEMALDPKTRLLIYKMVNNSVLESISGIISTGKESAVIHAIGGVYEDEQMPSECAIKVSKTYITDFKTRERYIRDDYRFKDRMSKNNNRMTIQLWAEKEFHNLRRLHKAGVCCPKPILIKKHVLVMSFIGNGQKAAPKLKHIALPYEDWCIAYEQVEKAMIVMFQGCRLVHGDMSEYNILYHDELCWVIDLGQAVEPNHPNALKFLLRDCSNIIRFFKSRGLTELPTPTQLFEKICGLSLPEENSMDRLADYDMYQGLWKESLATSSNEQFEFLWKEIQKDENRIKKNKDCYDVTSDLEEEEEEEGGEEEEEEGKTEIEPPLLEERDAAVSNSNKEVKESKGKRKKKKKKSQDV